MKGTLRHAWQGLIGLIAVGGILAYQFFFSIVKTGYGAAATRQGMLYVFMLAAAVNLFRVFLNQTPVFRIEAASVLLTYNTRFFQRSLQFKQFFSALFSIIISGTIAFLFSGFLLNAVFLKIFIALSLYFCNGTGLSWIFYHAKGGMKWAVCLDFIICTAALLMLSAVSLAVSALSLCMVWICVWKLLKLNLPKYCERIQVLESASVAASQNDLAKMQQMADENRPSYVREPMLHHLKPSKRTALWCKSILEIIRMQKQTLSVLLMLLLAGWIVARTKLLSFVPLLDDPAITGMIAVLCTTAALSSLYQLLIKQAKNTFDKRMLGLSLPFTTTQIIASYGMTAGILNILLAIIIGLLYSAFSPRLLLLFFAGMLAYLIPCCAQIYSARLKRGATMAANIILFAGIYFCLTA